MDEQHGVTQAREIVWTRKLWTENGGVLNERLLGGLESEIFVLGYFLVIVTR